MTCVSKAIFIRVCGFFSIAGNGGKSRVDVAFDLTMEDLFIENLAMRRRECYYTYIKEVLPNIRLAHN